ncbi:TPA: SymE family type I addiction module toxin [Providencia rettgeri]
MAKRDCSVKTPTAKEEVLKTRNYTVGYTPNRGKPNPNPQLIFSGKWLSELGFTVSSNVTLTHQAGQLIIRLAEGGVRRLKRSQCGAGLFSSLNDMKCQSVIFFSSYVS